MKKYELILNDSIEKSLHLENCKLFRIRALIDFDDVKAGDLGGYIQSEKNLSQDGNAWVADKAKVYGNAEVSENAKVCGEAEVYYNAKVFGDAKVSDHAKVCGEVQVASSSKVSGHAEVLGQVLVWGEAEVTGNARVWETVEMSGKAKVSGDADVFGHAVVFGEAEVSGTAKVSGSTELFGDAKVTKLEDVIVFKNYWSSGDSITYTKSNKMWKVYHFYGTGQELIDEGYRESKTSGDHYKAYVDFVESLEQLDKELNV